jgi:FkbM family methyltransferase
VTSFNLTARRLLETTTRNWSFKRRLQTDRGDQTIVVSPSAGLKYLFKPLHAVDSSLLRNAAEIVGAGDTVWDIGANVGLFTFAAAARAGPTGKVAAFEPDAWLVQLLRRSVQLQTKNVAPVMVVPAAIGKEVAIRSFSIASRSRASNSLEGYGHSQQGSIAELQSVAVLDIPTVLKSLPAPNVVKCDVEGAECEVFSNAAPLWDHIRPVIVCEIGAETAPQMKAILERANYRLFDGERSLRDAAQISGPAWSTVAIPAEKVLRYTTSPASLD